MADTLCHKKHNSILHLTSTFYPRLAELLAPTAGGCQHPGKLGYCFNMSLQLRKLRQRAAEPAGEHAAKPGIPCATAGSGEG